MANLPTVAGRAGEAHQAHPITVDPHRPHPRASYRPAAGAATMKARFQAADPKGDGMNTEIADAVNCTRQELLDSLERLGTQETSGDAPSPSEDSSGPQVLAPAMTGRPC